MTAAISRSGSSDGDTSELLSVADLVLARVAAGGAHRADLQRDLAPLLAPETPGTVFRRQAEAAIAAQVAQQLLTDGKGRLQATPAGARLAAERISVASAPAALPQSWEGLRDALVLRALALTKPAAPVLKALNRPEGLAALMLQRHYGLANGRVLSLTDLRAELAVVALERAFGNKIKTGLGKGSGLPAKAGRLLAGQLFKPPREFTSDGKLILALAADHLGAREATVDGFKTALLKRLVQPAAGTPAPAQTALRDAKGATFSARPQRSPRPHADNDASPLGPSAEPLRINISPPDMSEFCSAVLATARPLAEGWSGNRKVFISLVWKAIRQARPDWGLSEIAFKSMLAEAHRTGRVELTGADLKDSRDLNELEDSKILYKNTVWHFVRVED